MYVNTGFTNVRDRMNNTGTPPTHIAVGTGTTAATVGDTALETEVFRGARTTATPAFNKFRHDITLGVGDANGNTLTEVGSFNAAAAGTMNTRTVHTGIAKNASLILKYQIETEVT